MSIRAVIFDYGMVLSNPQDPEAHRNLLAITGLDRDTFERAYWHHRRDYDLGLFDGPGYWHAVAREAGVQWMPDQIPALIENDILMWASLNQRMLSWAASLQQAGIATAILSNMVPDMLRYMRQEFTWLAHFAHHTFSCELRIAKPDPAIYTWTCDQLGVPPADALFIDDKSENIEAAEQIGLHAILFTSVDQLLRDLESRTALHSLPRPGQQDVALSA